MHGALNRKLDRLIRPGREFPKLTERMRRPAIFALLFWSVLVLACVSYLFSLTREEHRFGFLTVVLGVAALVVTWAVLPWDPHASRRRKLAAPAFLLCTLGVGFLTGSVWALGLYAVSFANGVFLLGFGWGIAYAFAVLPVVFVNYLMLLSILFPGRIAVGDALLLTTAWVPVAVFVIGVCATIVDAVRGREEKGKLLKELEAAHDELRDYAGRVRELSVAEERARMAREIHDSVGHHLTVVNLQLQNAERFREKRPEEAWAEVEDARKTALEALAEVRRSVRALKPLDLEEQTVAGAILALVRTFEGTGIEVSFEVAGEERDLPNEAELVLYRTVQEGLTNAAKHSGARRVAAKLTFEAAGARLAVVDDGSGAGGGALQDGFGLASLRGRVEALGGSFAAGNCPEGGYALEARLPLASSQAPSEGS